MCMYTILHLWLNLTAVAVIVSFTSRAHGHLLGPQKKLIKIVSNKSLFLCSWYVHKQDQKKCNMK